MTTLSSILIWYRKTKQNKTKQNKTKQNKTKQNKTKTKQKKNKSMKFGQYDHLKFVLLIAINDNQSINTSNWSF